jgi:succinyl-CoA synthetase alpha subunit
MNRLLPEGVKLIGQGITGGEGSRALPRMLSYGTQIMAGVTPGKGGQELEGIKIYNSVKEALEVVGKVDGSVQFIPPLFVLGAVKEAIEAGIKWILIGAEKVPTKDEAIIYALAKENDVAIIGPSSVGLVNPKRKLRIGLIAAADTDRAYVPGNIAIISKSGSMTAEIGVTLKNAHLGVSWAVGIGGDVIPGTDYVDFLLDLEEDSDTKATVIFGELGGTHEEKIAKAINEGKLKKPIVALIVGDFTQKLPSEVQFGHAGAIIEGKRGLPEEKRRILAEAGVKVAKSIDDIPDLVKEVIK